MTDKEILAELKKSYEFIYDIRENGCIDHCLGQMETNLIQKLEVAKSNIEDIYYEFYKTLDKETLRVKSLEKDDNKIYISSDVSFDYESSAYSLSCEDVDYYWYEDQDFLNGVEYDTKFYVKLWITEHDRDQGYVEEYYKNFNNLEDAIKDLRTYFYDGNCACVEIYDSSNKLCYCCDKESEDFYINDLIIRHVDKKVVNEFIDCWCDRKKLPVDYDLLYCKDENCFVAIDNTAGCCYAEEFLTEEAAFEWLLSNEKEVIYAI